MVSQPLLDLAHVLEQEPVVEVGDADHADVRHAPVLDDVNLVEVRGLEAERLGCQCVVEHPHPLEGCFRFTEPNLRDTIVVDLVNRALHPVADQHRTRVAGPAVQDPSGVVVRGTVHRTIFSTVRRSGGIRVPGHRSTPLQATPQRTSCLI